MRVGFIENEERDHERTSSGLTLRNIKFTFNIKLKSVAETSLNTQSFKFDVVKFKKVPFA